MKKLIALLLTLCVAFSCCVITAGAANLSDKIIVDNELQSCNLQDYQDVIDRINEKYGTEVHFASDEEIKKLGIEVEPIDISPEEFETYISRLVEQNEAANTEAEKMSGNITFDQQEVYEESEVYGLGNVELNAV